MQRHSTFLWLSALVFVASPLICSPSALAQITRERAAYDEASSVDRTTLIWTDDLKRAMTVYTPTTVQLVPSASIGLHVTEAGNVLTAQLAIPKGQGVVVTRVVEDGPAAQAGVELHDVLLTLAGKPIADGTALNKLAGEFVGKTVPLTIVRRGKKLTIQVSPAKNKWDVAVLKYDNNRHWIGVNVSEVDPALREQLRLPENRGLVVTKIESESPAEKAGIKLHDILLEFSGKPLGTTEDLKTQINEVGERLGTMKLVRGGERKSVEVTPAERPAQAVRWVTEYSQPLNYRVYVPKPVPVYRPRSVEVAPKWQVERPNDVQRAPLPLDPHKEVSDALRRARELVERIEALEKSLKTERQSKGKREE